MDLKITQEKVLEAAAKCSDAKRILETLFPECFKKSKIVFNEKQGEIEIDGYAAISSAECCTSDEFKGRALHLNSNFHWELHRENLGYSLVFKKI